MKMQTKENRNYEKSWRESWDTQSKKRNGYGPRLGKLERDFIALLNDLKSAKTWDSKSKKTLLSLYVGFRGAAKDSEKMDGLINLIDQNTRKIPHEFDGFGFELDLSSDKVKMTDILWAHAAKLFEAMSKNMNRLKVCLFCPLLFWDSSKNHRRVFCSNKKHKKDYNAFNQRRFQKRKKEK